LVQTIPLPLSLDAERPAFFLRPGAGESQGRALRFDTQTRNPAPAPKFAHSLTRCTEISEGSAMDVARGEMVEKELDAMIERRARKGDVDPDEQEELWKASVRAYAIRRREELRAAWASYHEGQAERHRRTLEELASHHEAQAARLCEDSGARGEGVGPIE
jgi:hypothetical protein